MNRFKDLLEKTYTSFIHHHYDFKYKERRSLMALKIIKDEKMTQINIDEVNQYIKDILSIPFGGLSTDIEDFTTRYLFGNEVNNSFLVGYNNTIAHVRIGEEYIPENYRRREYPEDMFFEYYDEGIRYLGILKEIRDEECSDSRMEVVSFRYITETDVDVSK